MGIEEQPKISVYELEKQSLERRRLAQLKKPDMVAVVRQRGVPTLPVATERMLRSWMMHLEQDDGSANAEDVAAHLDTFAEKVPPPDSEKVIVEDQPPMLMQ